MRLFRYQLRVHCSVDHVLTTRSAIALSAARLLREARFRPGVWYYASVLCDALVLTRAHGNHQHVGSLCNYGTLLQEVRGDYANAEVYYRLALQVPYDYYWQY